MSNGDFQIGKRLKDVRELANLTQRSLERYSGVSQSTIQRIEAGQRKASVSELTALADACGVLVADLQGTNTMDEHVLCAGRTDKEGSRGLAEYLLFALGLSQRLDELGVPETA